MNSLTDIANSYGTDKGTVGPSNGHGGHNYTDIYEAYLSHLRETPITLLEIGIGLKHKDDPRIAHGRNAEGGASIKMWQEYFPKAIIYALDFVEAKWLENERVRTFVVDQSSEESLNRFIKGVGNTSFDVIIDDGSHHPDHQQLSLEVLFPLLKSGGLYFVEDLQRNGKGDRIKGTVCEDRALNTRSVLREFTETGSFGEPNVFSNTSYLKAHIAGISFHVPTRRIRRDAVVKRFFGVRSNVLEYSPDSELLCAIRKSAA